MSEVNTSSNIDDFFNGSNRALAASLIEITSDLRDYWPLTVRQVYYQAVARLIVPNDQNQYKRTSRVLTTLRREDLLDWSAIEDRTRRTIDKRGVSNLQAWATEQMGSFFNWRYYHRCYVQQQTVYVELATEKDALSKIVEDAAWMYCTRVNVVRGQVSATMVNDMATRFEEAAYRGQRPVLLYLGDLDPSGIAIPKALVRNMWDHHGVRVELRRVALQPEQVAQYSLPVSLDAAKRTDNNFGAWVREYGIKQAAVELDALHPESLTGIVEGALKLVYDLGAIVDEKRAEQAERARIKQVRRRIEQVCFREFPDVFAQVGR